MCLTSILQEGEFLYYDAKMLDSPVQLARFRRMHRTWVLDCLPALADGFETETVAEFVHVNRHIPDCGSAKCVGPFAVRAMGDALDLVRGLRATLDYDP